MASLTRSLSRTTTRRTLVPALPPSRRYTHHLNRIPVEGRNAIVTGSSRGIGKAIALRLAHDGYNVTVNDIPANERGAEAVAKEIQQMGRKSTVAIADVSKYGEVERMIEQSVKEVGELNTMYAETHAFPSPVCTCCLTHCID